MIPNAFDLGGPNERPLQFYVNASMDTMHYFKVTHELINERFMEIVLSESKTIDRFDKALEFSMKFDKLLDDLLLLGRMIV